MQSKKLKRMILDLLHTEDSKDKPLTMDRIWQQIPEQLRGVGTTRRVVETILKQLQKSGIMKKTATGFIPSRKK